MTDHSAHLTRIKAITRLVDMLQKLGIQSAKQIWLNTRLDYVARVEQEMDF